MFEILIAVFIGIIGGMLTGLIPGIHTNLLVGMIMASSTLLLEIVSVEQLIISIIAMGVVHSFLSFIPSLLFGVPESSTALSLLPGHKLVLEGKALLAVKYSAFGSLSAILISPLFLLSLYFFLEPVYTTIEQFIPYLLIMVSVLLILHEQGIEKKLHALIIFICSGALGLLSLTSLLIVEPLLVLFTGLFGTSGLIFSLLSSEKLPKQETTYPKLKLEQPSSLLGAGVITSLCSVSPGIGNAQAATLLSFFYQQIKAEMFIFLVSSINTLNFMLSFMTLYLLDKARNGAVVGISKLKESFSFSEILLYLGIFAFVGICSFFLMLYLGKKSLALLELNPLKINLSLLLFLLFISSLLSPGVGILLLITSTFLGLLCLSLGVARIHMMGVLLLPVIFFLL